MLAAIFPTMGSEFSVRISGRESSKELINIDGAWRKDCPRRMKVTLRSKSEIPAHDLTFKAYYFDGEGNVLREQDKPNSVWARTRRGIEEVGMPDPLPSGILSTVYLAVLDDLKDHRHTLVVFGSGDDLVATVYPANKPLKDFDFPEKELVLSQQE